jgi:hypothetical protein
MNRSASERAMATGRPRIRDEFWTKLPDARQA